MNEEVRKIILEKDEIIWNLEKRLLEKEEELLELKSQLDKFRSVVQTPVSPILSNSKRPRNCGISGEPGSVILPSLHPSSIKIVPKNIKTEELINNAIEENDFLKNLKKIQIKHIINSMYPVKFLAGNIIIKEGDLGSILYVIEAGTVEVHKQGKKLNLMSSGKVFGELAILYNCLRTATVTASTDCFMWAIDRHVFQAIMVSSGLKTHNKHIRFLESIPAFGNLNKDQISKMADVLEEVHYKEGDYIVRQYAKGDTLYIISRGKVKMTKKVSGEDVFLKFLFSGDYFGEKALEIEDVRSANLVACGKEGVDCLVLDRESYKSLIVKLDHVIKSVEEDFPKRNGEEMSQLTSLFSNLKLENISVIKTLGIGGFGRVELVILNQDKNKSYALKKLKKSHIIETRQQEHIVNEKIILSVSNSDFIVRLFKTFQDSKNLYMILEACLGGELWTILRDKGNFDDVTTRFYTSTVIEALTYLHERGIVYRDLKPENLLLDQHGYTKLVDFGFAKQIGYNNKTWTFCGTPEYVAPEIILNKGHDLSVDLWSLGILMFELLTGSPPFSGPDPMKIYNMILKGITSIDFQSKKVSKFAQQLIKKLCKENPPERLGYGINNIKEICKDRWFDGFNWEGLRRGSIKPPFKPELKNCLDFSNFDDYPSEDLSEGGEEETGWDIDF